MKRTTVWMLAIVCVLVWTGCGSTRDPVITEENGKMYLTLPLSNEKVRIPEGCSAYAAHIDAELLREAEERLQGEIAEYSNNSGFYIGKDEEGNLLLCVEVIVQITPDQASVPRDEYVDGGCGVDHEHIFFSERITE